MCANSATDSTKRLKLSDKSIRFSVHVYIGNDEVHRCDCITLITTATKETAVQMTVCWFFLFARPFLFRDHQLAVSTNILQSSVFCLLFD